MFSLVIFSIFFCGHQATVADCWFVICVSFFCEIGTTPNARQKSTNTRKGADSLWKNAAWWCVCVWPAQNHNHRTRRQIKYRNIKLKHFCFRRNVSSSFAREMIFCALCAPEYCHPFSHFILFEMRCRRCCQHLLVRSAMPFHFCLSDNMREAWSSFRVWIECTEIMISLMRSSVECIHELTTVWHQKYSVFRNVSPTTLWPLVSAAQRSQRERTWKWIRSWAP